MKQQEKTQHVVWSEPEDDGFVNWCLVTQLDGTWADFQLMEVSGWHGDNSKPQFWEVPPGTGKTDDPLVAATFADVTVIKGFIKWDGCMEFTAEDHVCDGAKSVQRLMRAWLWALAKIHELMEARKDRYSNLLWEPVS